MTVNLSKVRMSASGMLLSLLLAVGMPSAVCSAGEAVFYSEISSGQLQDAKSSPVYHTEQELFPYIIECQDLGMQTITFQFEGDPSGMDLNLLRDAACAYKIHLNWTRVKGTTYNCTLDLTERHGRAVISALRSGEWDRLTDKQKDLYERAMSVVREAEANCSNDWEKELYLYDWICGRTSYNSKTVTGTGDMEDYITAYGVFYDGSANCQGYTDAFYLLGNLAGLNVDMQGCTALDGSGHITNTIEIDGRWLVVDVTLGDDKFSTESGGTVQCHATFNVGSDRYASEASIRTEVLRHPIFRRDTSDYYYNHTIEDPWFGYQASCTDLDTIARTAVERWIYHGDLETEMILLGQGVNLEALRPYLYDRAMSTGYAFSYYISSRYYSDYTLFRITFR